MTYNCAESQTRFCRAYITDLLQKLDAVYNSCDKKNRSALLESVNGMIDAMKQLYNGAKTDTITTNDAPAEKCRKYIADCLKQLADSYHKCNAKDRTTLRSNVNGMLDRMKQLYNDKKEENDTSDEE